MTQFGSLNGVLSDVIEDAVSWRRFLHQHPELAYDERQTSDFIASLLTSFGLVVHRGLATTGVVGTLSRGTSRRAIAIRADMDALPLQEGSGVAHASSVPGRMHACGHDGHMAIALAAACACARLGGRDGTVHFIFQPAEEGGAGARSMIEDGLFETFPCDAVYALHNWPALPVGACVVRDGPMMAANAVFEVTISGRGCHAAMPHEGTDCILAGSQLVTALQSVVSRNIDPLAAAVVSVTQIRAGETHNIIPDTCFIRGAARWFEDRVGNAIEQRILQLSQSVALAFGCAARVRFERRYPATINDAAAAGFVRSLIRDALPQIKLLDVAPSMASEDFAFMLKAVPGCYVWLGAGRQDNNCGLHSPQYDFNDEVLPLGVALWMQVVQRSLTNPPESDRQSD
jgi:amidohydrolase